MNYNLNQDPAEQVKRSTLVSLRNLLQLISHEKHHLLKAMLAIFINSGLLLLGPFLMGYAIDHKVRTGDYQGVLLFAGLLLLIYSIAMLTGYLQTKWMGSISQRMLFILRNAIFTKIQSLPVSFFNQNKSGDLISRINNDTDKINQFFSQALMQFIGSIVTMTGAGIFMLIINFRLGAAALAPAVLILLFTLVLSPWVKRKNATNLKSNGSLSAEVQESLSNFKVIVAFNRRDYFRKKFDAVNQYHYKTAIAAGLANNIFMPVYGLFAGLAQLVVLLYGLALIAQGSFTIGLLVSYFSYTTNFYNPLRQLAALWASFQVAMAGWDRISQILALDSDLQDVVDNTEVKSSALMEFKAVEFSYEPERPILRAVNFKLEKGKTYAFIGPTGGGKTTTASLIARLYDPTAGKVLLNGRDIRSFPAEERTSKIGFILQEPFLFSGTVKDNILYGNPQYRDYNGEQLEEVIKAANLHELLAIFDQGLDTPVAAGTDSISLGQKQLIAFMRAVLRQPELLILDEATANIDTVTEKLLDHILAKLPASTTLVVIAHRLNTIQRADEIYFVNAGAVLKAGTLEHAMDMLLNDKRIS